MAKLRRADAAGAAAVAGRGLDRPGRHRAAARRAAGADAGPAAGRDRARGRHHRLDRPGRQQVPGQDRLRPRQAARLRGDRRGGGARLPRRRARSRILPGVGPAFAKTLESDGFATVGDLAARRAASDLADRYGAHGLRLCAAGPRPRRPRRRSATRGARAISAETTFNDDLTALPSLEDVLWPLCEKVARHARARGDRRPGGDPEAAGRPTFASSPAAAPCPSRPRPPARCSPRRAKCWPPRRAASAWRLIGVGISDIVAGRVAGGDFFDGGESRALSGEKAIDAPAWPIRRRSGGHRAIAEALTPPNAAESR